MTFEAMENLWNTNPHGEVRMDMTTLLNDLKHRERDFQSALLWRDSRELIVAVLLLPFWIYSGITKELPWTWWLGVPALLFVGGYILIDRLRQARLRPVPGDTPVVFADRAIAAVEHQVALLRRVFWWYLLPIDIAVGAFFLHVGWNARVDHLVGAVVGTILLLGFLVGLTWGIYWLNQFAIRRDLQPRLAHLTSLQASLAEATEK